MAFTTLGVKLADEIRQRLKAAAEAQGQTPHWAAKQMILAGLERLERGETLHTSEQQADCPFLEFARDVQPQTVLRAAITAAYRRPEEECLPALLAAAALPPNLAELVQKTAKNLVVKLRAKRSRGIVETLLQEYALSSQEGIALMCLAEALLRIPDSATRDALIRDKISAGNWHSHLGGSPSLFVNAASWGLLLTGRLTATNSESGLTAALTRLLARGGEPVLRAGLHLAMRLMGEQFVSGQTIADALANSRKWEARGFRYSYDMLGEAALTAEDAARYLRAYTQAIHAIGKAARSRGIYEGAGISIKLSALHPRYTRAQRGRVMAELLQHLIGLASLARSYEIGLNIDAEEADRLELSLDLLEALCFEPALAGWNGIGFVVQAYQKRAPFVLDFLIDLAHRSKHRLMVRLVKGAYWDSARSSARRWRGWKGFRCLPGKSTRMSLTSPARAKCWPRRRPSSRNSPRITRIRWRAIYAMAGENFYAGQYEFQCLHGMGEAAV